MKYGLDEQTAKSIENWLEPNDHQRPLPTSAILWFYCGLLCNYSSVICFISSVSVVCLLDLVLLGLKNKQNL